MLTKGNLQFIVILLSEKTDYKAKSIARDKEGHFIIIKEDITILHFYISNDKVSTYISEKKIGQLIIIVEHFSIPSLVKETRQTKQSCQDTENLSNANNK